MSYYESAEGETITHARALREIEKHGCMASLDDFYAECGRLSSYSAQAVLLWLGY